MAPEGSGPDYLERNRSHWDDFAPEWVEGGRREWGSDPSWGEWGVPETELGLLADIGGAVTLEVGCGTGYVSSWIARRGASPVGLDNSWQQLSTAATLQDEFNLSFPLIHGVGEALPFTAESFDMVISEYGAAIWSDPYVWIPEAARVLRPGGRLTFLGNSVLFALTVQDEDGNPAGTTLLREQFGMHRFEWPDDISVEFHLSHGDMIRLLRANSFEVLDLIEIKAPEGPAGVRFNVARDWARSWPAEEVWLARKQP